MYCLGDHIIFLTCRAFIPNCAYVLEPVQSTSQTSSHQPITQSDSGHVTHTANDSVDEIPEELLIGLDEPTVDPPSSMPAGGNPTGKPQATYVGTICKMSVSRNKNNSVAIPRTYSRSQKM